MGIKHKYTIEEIMEMLEACREAISEYIEPIERPNDISKKIAVYSMTKNCYEFGMAAIKSLLVNSNVDKVYLIGDGDFPKDIPNVIKTMEVDTTKYISPISPNWDNRYTHYCLIRLAFYDIFKQYDQVLSLDYDVIFDHDVSPLFDINLGDKYYIGGVKEPYRTVRKILGYYGGYAFKQMNGGYTEPDLYVNAGVLLLNLRKIRDDGIGPECLGELNKQFYLLPEQDIFNIMAKDKIYLIPDKYNIQKFTPKSIEPYGYHFAGEEKKMDDPLVSKYKDMSWDKILLHRQITYGK